MSHAGGKVIANLRDKFVLHDKIRWYPGHMTKGLRQMQQQLKNVDCILEVHDARVPISGRFADYSSSLTSLKPHILVLSKNDLADAKYSKSIASALNAEGLSNVIFTNLKNQSCKNMKQILPLAKKLIKSSNRYNRTQEESFSMMVIGVPNVGKSSLINRLRSNHLGLSKATHVGAVAGITRSVLTRIKISEDPTIYLLDTPGILIPTIKDNDTGLKLALVGCMQDHVVGSYTLADYLLFWLNRHERFEYVDKLGLQEPNDNVTQLLVYIAAKLGKTVMLKGYDGRTTVQPDLQSAAEYFVSLFRKGELGSYCLDADSLETNPTSQNCHARLA